MSAPFGFVYILINDHMQGVYKVGCTERSPHARAEELSRPTGIPSPFKVLVYAEVRDFQHVERRMHDWLSRFRISENREFFQGGLEFACRCLFWLPGRLSFGEPLVVGEYGALKHLWFSGEWDTQIYDWTQTTDPFSKPEAKPEGAEQAACDQAEAAAPKDRV